MPFARGGWPFENAKVPTCAPRGLVGPLVNLLEPTNMFSRLFFCGGSRGPASEGGGPTRAPRTHTSCAPESRVATSHLVTPAGRCRRCCLEQCLEGGGRKALRPLGHNFLSRLFEQDSKRIFNLTQTQPRQPPCAFLRSSLTSTPQVSWSERAVARVERLGRHAARPQDRLGARHRIRASARLPLGLSPPHGIRSSCQQPAWRRLARRLHAREHRRPPARFIGRRSLKLAQHNARGALYYLAPQLPLRGIYCYLGSCVDLARGAACPRACDAQDTTKQTGAFSLPLFSFAKADEAWQSSC